MLSCIVIPCVCFVVLLCCRFFLFVFLTYPDIMLHYFFNMSSMVISHTDIPLSSDIFIDSLIIDTDVL